MTPESEARDTELVAGTLKRHLERHDVDTAHIVGRVREGLAAERAPRPRARLGRLVPSRAVGAAAAAAGVAAVIVAATLALRLDDGGSISPANPLTQAPTPATATPSNADEDSATTAPPTGAEDPATSATLAVATARPSSTSVRISGAEVGDFIVAGVDETDAFVTARRNVQTQVLTSGAVGNPASAIEAGPFAITWDGGQAPYASGRATDWFVVRPTPGGPDSGVVVQAVGAPSGSEIVVHVGVAGPEGRVEALVGDEVHATRVVPGDGSDFALYTVTMTINEVDALGDTVAVRVLAPDGGAVGLAAAVLASP